MPASVKLHEKFKGEDIVFVYLSIDKDPNNWKNAITSLLIANTGEHYRRNQDDIAELLKFLYVYSIPHYLIVGKDGQLVNPMDYIDKSGVIMTVEVPQLTQTSSGETSSETSGETITKKGNLDIDMGRYSSVPDFVAKAVNQFKPNLKLTEQMENKETKYLQFCNVSNPSVRNGQQVSIGTTLGETDTDVVVSNFDSNNSRIKLKKGDFNLGKNLSEYLNTITIPKDSNKKIKSPVSGVVNTKFNQSCRNQIIIEYTTTTQTKTTRPGVKEPTFTDPLLGAILTAPLKVFKDKYDDSGNLKQKRFGYAGERVDPWIKDAIVAPFEKIGSLYRKEKTEEEVERKKKKVNENIERIKKLL
jgi:hypothetical protein